MTKSLKSTLVFGILSIIFLILYYFLFINVFVQLLAVLAVIGFLISLIIFLVVFPYKYFSEHRTFIDKILEDNRPWGVYLLITGIVIAFLANFSYVIIPLTGIDISRQTALGKVLEFVSSFGVFLGIVIIIEQRRRRKIN